MLVDRKRKIYFFYNYKMLVKFELTFHNKMINYYKKMASRIIL